MRKFVIAAMVLVIASGSGWLQYDRQNSENNSFLHERPWAWMESDIGWATPFVSPRDARHPRIEQWGFDLEFPAGYYEFHRVPAHMEICIRDANYHSDCKMFGKYEGEL